MAEAVKIRWYGKQVFTQATDVNITAMHTAGLIVEADVKTHFTKVGSYGKGVRRTQTGKRHYAAAPGKPPAIDMGILRASIVSDVQIKGGNVIGRVGPDIEHIAAKAEAGTDINYGLYLELGTVNMQPRPFLRPALQRTRKQVERIFKKANGK